MLCHTPDGISDEIASTLPVPGLTASAALEAIGLRFGDTVLIGGAHAMTARRGQIFNAGHFGCGGEGRGRGRAAE